MKKFIFLLGVFFLINTQFVYSANKNTSDNKSDKVILENDIQLAESYYLLMLEEGIGTYAQKKSERYIQKAKKILNSATISNDDKKSFSLQINTIERELQDSIAIKYHTLEGYFPLLKYTASSFFFSPEESEVHTLIKSPDFIALKNATKSLISSLSAPGEVVFNSVPHNSKLEKLSFAIFNSESSLSSHTNKDVVSVLNNEDLISRFEEDNITKEIAEKLFKAYSGNPLYIVTIEREPSDKREYFYSLNARYFDAKGFSKEKSISSSAYAVDERGNWMGLITVHIFFLLLAFVFTYFNQKKWDHKLFSMTFLFFLFGRVFPLILVPSIMAFRPDVDTHIIYSLWWVFVMGIAVFVLPVIALKMFYGRVTEYLPLPDIAGKGEMVGVAIASGILAFLTVPYIFGFGNTLNLDNVIAFVLLSVAVLLSGFVMGKVLDDNDKMDEKNLVVFAITSALMMAAFLHGQSIYLIAISLLSIVLAGGLFFKHSMKIKKEIEENNKLTADDEIIQDVVCHNLEEVDLSQIVQDPPYQKYDYYKDVFDSIQSIYDGVATYCALKGDGGAGKTVTAKILIDTIGRTFTEKNEPVIFLSSNCERQDAAEVPYGMFYDLLDSTLSMDLFGQREKDEKFDNVVNMASRFMMGPVASFLASKDSGEQKSFSKNDIYIHVKKQLQELSEKSTVILFIDDAQWIDSASKELLKYLIDEFPAGSGHKILFLFTVRDTELGNDQIRDMGIDMFTHLVGYIDRSEQRVLLEKSFCLSPESSQWIVNWASEQNSDRIYPYILVDAVGNLVRTDVLEIVDDRFNIKEDFDFDNPPIPEGPQKEIKQFFEKYPEHTEVLSFAAIFGKEFQVSHIANGLDVSYLETVKMLDEIARVSGFVFDLMDKDDAYQFRSQILLDALREHIGYSTDGILSSHVSQAIRHYHALAANALKNTEKDDPSSKLTMEIANHYYAAGKLYANDAVEYMQKAVNACRRLFEYDDALAYLGKIDEVISQTKKDSAFAKELRLIVESDKANVQGINADSVAEKILAYIEEYPDCSDELKLAGTRACYDAALQNNYSQEWFAKSSQVAKKYLLRSDSKLIQSEGHHFAAICMKPQTDGEKKEQLDHFREAIDLTKDGYPEAYAKIANSLAETLSYGDEESKEKAKNLFMESLQIKEDAEIKDLPGIARTYGGLGRLVFFASPPKIEEAREYFQKDLEIAEEINDQRGISQMNSFLGSCSKSEEKYEDAIVFYDESIQMKNNPFDVHASYEGKFFSLLKLENTEDIITAAKEYEAILEKIGTPPGFLIKSISAVVETCKDNPACQKILDSLQADG